MRLPLSLIFMVILAACNNTRQPTGSIEGAWLGKGDFNTGLGSQEVTAQLEILSDGTYRAMILKPSVLALMGMEKGNWSVTGDQLHLSPVKAPPPAKPSLLNAPKDFPAKTYTVESLSKITFNDGKMDIVYTPNLKVTEKLIAEGVVLVE